MTDGPNDLVGRLRDWAEVNRMTGNSETLSCRFAIEAAARIEALEAALKDVREDICVGPVDDVLWRVESPMASETTVDFICNALGDDWTYDGWKEARALQGDLP